MAVFGFLVSKTFSPVILLGIDGGQEFGIFRSWDVEFDHWVGLFEGVIEKLGISVAHVIGDESGGEDQIVNWVETIDRDSFLIELIISIGVSVMYGSSADGVGGSNGAEIESGSESDHQIEIDVGVFPFKLNANLFRFLIFRDNEHLNVSNFVVFLDFEGFAGLGVFSSPNNGSVGDTGTIWGSFCVAIAVAVAVAAASTGGFFEMI
jgi:hypothetical protein